MWKNILWTVEHLDKEQTTYLNPIFEGIWWQSSHQKTPLPVWRQLIPRFFIEVEMKPHGICVGGRETLI